MPHSISPIKNNITLPEAKSGAKKIVIPAKARLTAKMSQDILNALEQKPFELDVHIGRVAALRKDAKKVVPALGRAFHALKREQFHERFAVVNLLNEIDDDAALPEFVRIIESPVEKSTTPSQGNLLEKQRDAMIRTLALEGVGQLAHNGNPQAIAALEHQLRHPSFSVRRASVQALLALDLPEMREKISAVLPEKEHFLLDLKVMAPRDILRTKQPFFIPKKGGKTNPVLPFTKTNRPPEKIANKADLFPGGQPPKSNKPEGN